MGFFGLVVVVGLVLFALGGNAIINMQEAKSELHDLEHESIYLQGKLEATQQCKEQMQVLLNQLDG